MTGPQLVRDDLVADGSLIGRALCEAYADRADTYLRNLFATATATGLGTDGRSGVSLVALGGYGRRELSLQSDLDVLLLHDGRKGIGATADALWYPVWDTGVKLGHAVRTTEEALALAGEDLDSATALLQARHIAGDQALTGSLLAAVGELWTRRAETFLPLLAEGVRRRHARAGEVAFLLEPDLKEGRGGLRDVHSLHWAARARPMLWRGDDVALEAAYDVLLATRVELHRLTGRFGDVLTLQEQDSVARALGHHSADDLMRTVSAAARTIAFCSDDAWRRIERSITRARAPMGTRLRRSRSHADGSGTDDAPRGYLARRASRRRPTAPPPDSPSAADSASAGGYLGRRARRRRPDPLGHDGDARPADATTLGGPAERGVAPGIVVRDGEVHLTAHADLGDPALPLVVAARAASEGAQVHRSALDAMAAVTALPDPWPGAARDALVRLLGTGRPAIALLESLDQHDLLTRILPEWGAVRSKPQRNAYHTFTVDRHLCEAAANAAALAPRVRRPDLLLVGTLLHDIGKGFPGDHTAVGMELVEGIGRRMGFPADDVATLVAMVEHHLLLPDVATRRDLDDPDVIDRVAEQVRSPERLDLLHALTEADSLATGPAAWGPWKAELVETLVRRVQHVLGGGEVDDVTTDFPGVGHLALVREDRRVVEGTDQVLTVIEADRPGLFSRVTGVLAIHGLAVLHADIATIDGRALEVLTLESSFGPVITWDKVIPDVERALDGRLAIEARLSDRVAAYRSHRPRVDIEPKVEFHLDDSSTATVVDVHAFDSVGVLHRITAAISELDLDIVRARVQTLGDQVVDSFYLQGAGGGKIAEDVLPELRRAILHAVR